jgi:hypothetical protein
VVVRLLREENEQVRREMNELKKENEQCEGRKQ